MLTKRQKLRKTYKRAVNRILAGRTESTPVFIFGEMRSGTNMLADCLDYCPRTEVFHETDDDAFSKYELKSTENTIQLIGRSSASHVVFKAIADSSRAVELLQACEGSRAFWIYRRYEDVVNSALRKWQEHNRYLYKVLHNEEGAAWRRANLSEDHLKLIADHYERGLSEASARALIWYVRNDLFFDQELQSHPNVWLMNYEELVNNPATCLEPAFDFVGLQFRSAFVKHVSTKSVRKHQPPEIDEQVKYLCAELKRRLDAQLHAQNRQSSAQQ